MTRAWPDFQAKRWERLAQRGGKLLGRHPVARAREVDLGQGGNGATHALGPVRETAGGVH